MSGPGTDDPGIGDPAPPGGGPPWPPDLDDEVRHHLQETVDLLVAEGWGREDAVSEALRRFGDAGRVSRRLDRMARRRRLRRALARTARAVGSDVRWAGRSLRRNRGHTASVVATVGLALGLAAAIFAAVDAALLRPLAYRHAERLYEAGMIRPDGRPRSMTVEEFAAWRRASEPFADAWLGYVRELLAMAGDVSATDVSALYVTPGADTLVGIPVRLGRTFTEAEAAAGAPVAVLGPGLHRRLGGDRSVLGRTLRLDTGPVTVIGVLGGDVKFPDYSDPPDLWLPLAADGTIPGGTRPSLQEAWARLRAGVSAEAADAAARRIASELERTRPSERGWSLALEPLGSRRRSDRLRTPLWLLTGTAALLLVTAFVNSVNLVLARGAERARELVVRGALGASHLRLRRQLLFEGIALGLLAAAVAVAGGWAGLEAIRPLVPDGVLFRAPHPLVLDARVVAFTAAVALVGGAALGAFPAWRLTRGAGSLSAHRTAGDSRAARRGRRALVVVQVALSTMLLAGASVLLKSLVTLVRVDPGFDHERVLFADLIISSTTNPTPEDRAAFVTRLAEALRRIPGVEGVAWEEGNTIRFGVALQAEGDAPMARQPDLVPETSISPDYLDVLGIELVEGRAFRPSDPGRDVVIVDRDLATALWGPTSAVGRRFRFREGEPWLEVVGVVRDLRMMGRDQRAGPGQILHPPPESGASSFLRMAVRTPDDPASLVGPFRETLGRIDPLQATWKLRTGSAMLAEEEEMPRFLTLLVLVIAGAAVALSAVGLYGVLAYTVRRRVREIGVRMTLGAGRRTTRRMVVADGLGTAAAGVALGLAGAVAGRRVLESLVYEVQPASPDALATAGGLFLAVALVACWLPARRATAIDPVEALRAE